MFARFGKMLVLLALVFSTGLHWAALQTVAWTTMLAANFASESLTQSVADTFDGDHPCPLCRAVRSGQKSEQKSPALALKLKMEFPPVADLFVLVPPPTVPASCPIKLSADSSFNKPPVPPPRGGLV